MKTAIALQGNQSPALRLGHAAKRVNNLIGRVALPTAVISCVVTLVCAVTGNEVACAASALLCLVSAMNAIGKGGEA